MLRLIVSLRKLRTATDQIGSGRGDPVPGLRHRDQVLPDFNEAGSGCLLPALSRVATVIRHPLHERYSRSSVTDRFAGSRQTFFISRHLCC